MWWFMIIRMRMGIMGIRGIVNRNWRRSLRRPIFSMSRRLDGRNGETWEGAHYVRPPNWIKNVLRKRYLS
jgi:hypothetical protein